jgi:hypothetical protein
VDIIIIMGLEIKTKFKVYPVTRALSGAFDARLNAASCLSSERVRNPQQAPSQNSVDFALSLEKRY